MLSLQHNFDNEPDDTTGQQRRMSTCVLCRMGRVAGGGGGAPLRFLAPAVYRIGPRPAPGGRASYSTEVIEKEGEQEGEFFEMSDRLGRILMMML